MFNIYFWFFSSQAFSAEYQALQDQTWDSCQSSSLTVDYYGKPQEINYRYCSYNNSIDFEFIRQNLERATEKVFEFAEKLDLNSEQCVNQINLEIYQISFETLNEKDRFGNWNNEGEAKSWGLYDPRASEGNVGSLMITDQGPKWNDLILAHEVSHYWYDRFCWNKKWQKPDEAFAQSFETFYTK